MRTYSGRPSSSIRFSTSAAIATSIAWRSLVESDISRWKRVIGDGLRFQTDGRQASEVAIAADVLNRMLELGRPEYVRIT